MDTPSTTGSQRRQGGLSAWLIPPARDWQRKSGRIMHGRLLLPLAALAAILLALAATAVWPPAAGRPSVQLGLIVAALALVAVTVLVIHRDLLVPLTHLRHWALRMRGGNLAARIPVPEHGEFAQLAADINAVGASLQSLSHDMAAQVSKQTERIEHKTRSLSILYDVAASINVASDLDDLLTRFLHTLRDVVHARAGVVRLITDDGRMPLVSSIGLDDEVVEKERLLPTRACVCHKAAAEGEVACHPNVHQCHRMVGKSLFPEGDDVAIIAVPLQYRDRTLGVYNLFVQNPAIVDREDLHQLLTSVGRHLGMAIEKARVDEESKRLSVIEERTRLAHELHDSLAQTLASLRFQFNVLDETLPEDQAPEVSHEIKRIIGSLDEAHLELRELIAHFRSPVHERGLARALEELVERFKGQTGIQVFLQNDCSGEAAPPNVAIEVLRIVQEALCNIRKHAEARTVRVRLRDDASGQLDVLIEDDGVGMEVPEENGGGDHIGLSIMGERARRVGGELRIDSEPGEGTRISLTVMRTPSDHRAGLLASQRVAAP